MSVHRKSLQTDRILGVTRTVFALGVVSLFMDISSETAVTVMPLFTTIVLGASPTTLGLIEGLAEATASLLKAWSGARSDRGARKPWAIAGYGLSALSKPLVALAVSWPMLLGARLLDRSGKGFRSAPRDALIAADTPKEELGRAFGLHKGMDTLGAAIGPLVAYALLPGLGYRGLLLLASVPALISVIVLLAFVRERPEEIAARREAAATNRASFPKDARTTVFLVAVGLFSLGNSSDAFLLLRISDLGVPAATVPLVYFAFNIVYAVSSPLAGRIADRLGRGRVARWGLGLFALIYSGFGLASSTWHAWALFALYGVFMAFTEGVWKAHLGELAPEDSRGAVYGAFNAVIGFAALPASLIAGWGWERFGHGTPFVFGAALALVAFLVLGFNTKSSIPNRSR